MKFNKLIRDRVIENWNPKFGKNPKTHIATDEEFYKRLKEKLLEESEEFVKSDSKEELADIQEIIDTICKTKNLSKEELEKIRKDKFDKNGGFEKKLILESSEG